MPVQTTGTLYTVDEAAEMLSLSEGTVRQYIQRGTLTPVRIGRAVLFSPHELARYQRERLPQGKHRE